MDSLHRFIFEDLPVRGEIVHLRDVWQETRQRRQYPEAVGAVLGQAMAASALMAATVKGDSQLTLQLQSQGPLHLLVSQCTGRRALRGLARWRDDELPRNPDGLHQSGTLAITLDPQDRRERYQGVVDIDGDNLADALGRYFAQSEQLPTLLALGADQHRAVGWLIQRLPGDNNLQHHLEWERVCHLAATVGAEEIAARDPAALLSRVFANDPIRLFPPESLHFQCSCSRDRIAAVLTSLGRGEVDDILSEQGSVGVACEFCGQDYRFDRVDCAVLFDATQTHHSDSRH